MILRPLVRSTSALPSIARSISSPISRTALRRPVLVAFGLTTASLPFLQPSSIIRNDSSPAADFSSTPYSHSRDAKTPVTRNGTLNPAAVKQISLGSILGLGAGLVVSAFSTSLTLFIGLGIVAWQLAARKGYNFIPVDRLQRTFTNFDLRSAINDNLAFKISFGLMFALAAFGDL
ncbi:hypothetical protein H2200_012118 [Cladophialophora chaetospira]|uniref:Fun14 family protein n=1 Tax=Cladophialophora chaetospira TaxID=386627 RepID=A0AA38WY78_9EURO|nr:hypothetical protein H2200_012118 [Cladophialophora chaetospira]